MLLTACRVVPHELFAAPRRSWQWPPDELICIYIDSRPPPVTPCWRLVFALAASRMPCSAMIVMHSDVAVTVFAVRASQPQVRGSGHAAMNEVRLLMIFLEREMCVCKISKQEHGQVCVLLPPRLTNATHTGGQTGTSGFRLCSSSQNQ